MNIYRISQCANQEYDTYDACIVAANTEEEARQMNPSGYEWEENYSSWCDNPSQVIVTPLGRAIVGLEAGFLLKSFNAGIGG